MSQTLPIPRRSVSVRVATAADLAFMDDLQKRHGRALGYFPTKQFEEYVAMGAVLIAEEVRGQKSEVSEDGSGGSPRLTSDLRPLASASPLGYVIARDRYLKRDELGVIYQLCVAPGAQRKLVGAQLVEAVFGRSAYGCRLYCCWCAKDLDANHFWESLGFVPVAFRAGSTGKKRVHIFWQKRICQGDAATPWWYPAQTSGGAIREDRLVFPIPPGTHWKDVEAVVLPGTAAAPTEPRKLAGPRPRVAKPAKVPPVARKQIGAGGLKFNVPPPAADAPPAAGPTRRARAPKQKADPKLVAAARELRDRYLEHVNAGGMVREGAAKYDVSRALSAPSDNAVPFLPARDDRRLPHRAA